MSRRGYPQNLNSDEQGHGEWIEIATGNSIPLHHSNGYQSFAADKIGPNTVGYPHVKLVNNYAAYRMRARFEPAHWNGEAGIPGLPPTFRGGGTYPFSLILGFNPLTDFHGGFLEGRNSELIRRKLAAKIKDQKVNIGVLAAEFTKTCGTVANAAQRIAGALRQLRRGNVSGAAGVLTGGRTSGGGSGGSGSGGRRRRRPPRGPVNHPPNSGSVAKDWLAIQYGWKPLLNDVYGATEELARTMTYRPPSQRVTASCSSHDMKDISGDSGTNFPSWKASRTMSCSTRGTICYEVASDAAQLATNTGILNPLAVAWELVPFSFVADWFIPVGGYLNSLDYNLGLSFTKGWITHKTTGSWNARGVGGTYSGGGAVQTWSGGAYAARVESMVRDPLAYWPSIPVPRWKNPLSLQHAANAIALLRVAVS